MVCASIVIEKRGVLALSVEIFIILYVKEIVRYVTVILFIDTFVLIGLLLMAVYRTTRKR